MHIDGHANCCGIYVLSGFYNSYQKANVYTVELCPDRPQYYRKIAKESEKTNEQMFDDIMKNYGPLINNYDDRGKIVEAVLTDRQLMNEDGFWAKKLKANGFTLSRRFRNTGGNVCNVFHLCSPNAVVEGPVPNWEVEENASN